MANANITYRVTGRYMTGSTVTAYHLVGEDGRQFVASKERIIFLIGKGAVENMRIQTNGDDMILRGKGINLNNLPVYDINKNNFRGNQASQTAAATNVAPKKNSGVNPMGQFKLTKRIMYKTNCLGYIVTDLSGQEKKFSRKRVVELATQRLLSNAIVQRYTPKGATESQLILRGVGCDISTLPTVAVDQYGKIIDTEENNNKQEVYMRAVRMKRGGIVHDSKKNKRIAFEPGDYILCGINGTLRPIKQLEAKDIFTLSGDTTEAVCDDYLENLTNYPIELFGSPAQMLNPNQVKRWPIVKVSKAG